MVFTPVRQARASGAIVLQIERAIVDGALHPGDRLESERELAEQFSVSRITVRDALRVLEARGLIRVKVGATGGAFVAETNFDHVVGSISTMIALRKMTLSELAEARTVVETATAELAAERADAAAVAEASKNELLSATVRAYRDLLIQTLHDMRDIRSARVTQKAHEEILEAIRARDGEATRKLMLEHLQDFEKRLRRYLQANEAASDGRSRPKAPPRSARIERIDRLRRASS